MSAAVVAVLTLVVTLISVAIGRRAVVGHKRRQWWAIDPQTPEIDFRAAALALAGTRKRGRSSSVTIVRARLKLCGIAYLGWSSWPLKPRGVSRRRGEGLGRRLVSGRHTATARLKRAVVPGVPRSSDGFRRH